MLIIASKSRRPPALIACRQRSARSGVTASSTIGPLLCEAFGGSTSLVDVLVAGDPDNHALHPCGDLRDAVPNMTRAACRTSPLDEDANDDSVAETEDLLHVEL